MLLTEESLSADAVYRIIAGEALALHVTGYHPPRLCSELSAHLLEKLDSGDQGYRRIYQSNICAFTETVGNHAAQEEYFSASLSAMVALRRSCHLRPSPVDRLRCELDEIWPGGASLLRINGRPLVFGMLRVWREGAQALPHLDILGETAPEIPNARSFIEQLGVNIYLRMPGYTNDGAVELWDLGLVDVDPKQHGIDGTYGYRRELLPAPTVVLHPAVGDLLLLRTTRIHAVRPTRLGERITLSGFVGCTSDTAPLRLWS